MAYRFGSFLTALTLCAAGCGGTGTTPTDDGSLGADLAQGDLAHVACTSDGDCLKSGAGVQLQCCNNACLDTSGDAKNCGACGKACATPANGTAACVSGACGIGSCTAGFGDCDKDAANGCEKSVTDDPANCGACGMACQSGSNATATCAAGKCALQCAAGFADCDGSAANGCETSTQSDANNCGGCAKACGSLPAATVACVTGACAIIACGAGFADCDGNLANGCEVNKQTDNGNCGACGAKCAFPNAAGSCNAGTCSLGACNTGFANCDGNATNGCEQSVASDVNNCGACGQRCTIANGAAACVNGACAVASCNAGYSDCDGKAINGCEAQPASDTNNCGGCGKACPMPANTTTTCNNGACGVGSCKFGYADCNNNASDGCEANLLSPSTCGTCTTVCSALPNASAGCNAGTCGLGTCNALFGNCDGNAANGCEKSLATDLSNCGACGKLCSPSNATGICLNGACGLSSCLAGYTDCDMSATNGCESYTAADPMNCGGCGKVCPTAANSVATCASSTCGIACASGFGNCDGNASNGCEIDLRTNVNNCGTCGKVCAAVANGAPGCSAGTCGISQCNTGYADCDNFAGNGCEISTLTNLNNCGACGKLCNPPNAVGLCLNGQCGVASCNAGYADCDGNPANGCESYVASDAKNCGACGKACPAAANSVATCSASTCGQACAAGYANCDNNLANGCEINLFTDVSHCGGCTTVCGAVANGTPACSSGACKVGSCNAGYGDCNGTLSDGCETSVLTNTSNCGGCGIVCNFLNANNACLNGVCGFQTCKANYGDCDGKQSTGCETWLLNDPVNCGACGNKCGAGTPYCQKGACSSTPCPTKSGRALMGPYRYNNYCYYLGSRGATCDQVCADLGGQNLTASAYANMTDNCFPPGATSPITWFFQNGNACNFTGPDTAKATGYQTIGHGYDTTDTTRPGGLYYDKCSTFTLTTNGSFPGTSNDDALRCDVCTCF